MSIGTILFRGLEVALIHMGCSAVIAAGLMLGIRLILRFRSGLTIKNRDVLMVISLLVVAPVLHVCHNTFHFNPIVQFIFVIATMGGLLVWTYFYDVEMIHRWLDTGLDKQLSLLGSIKKGHLNNTPTGNFLKSVKDVFPPEDYFEIISILSVMYNCMLNYL